MNEFETPNLDCMWSDDLEDLALVFSLLHQYAEKKSAAMRDRAAGNIASALDLETTLNTIYSNLPQWAKW